MASDVFNVLSTLHDLRTRMIESSVRVSPGRHTMYTQSYDDALSTLTLADCVHGGKRKKIVHVLDSLHASMNYYLFAAT
jgi:hypothetical protein